MYCKKCGVALPSEGFICKRCGTLMDSDQIKMQKEYMNNNKKEVTLMSDRYSNNSVNRDYTKVKENKYLGAILIVLVVIILIIIAILRVI